MPKLVDDTARRLHAAVGSAEALLPVLQRLMGEPDGVGPQTGTIGRYPPESKEPWNPAAANAYWAIYMGARNLANEMRKSIGLTPKIGPFGSAALADIVNLAAAVTPDTLNLAAHRLERWCDEAQQVSAIDESEPWVSVPKAPGAVPPACPYCHTFSLRMLARRGEVRCFHPGCTDSEGRPTRARMERGRMTGESCLVFGDDTMVHFRKDDDDG